MSNIPSQRMETDSFGEIAIPATAFWGAQTQRSLTHFDIGTDRLSKEMVRAYALIKRAAAEVSAAQGRLPSDIAEAICGACNEILANRYQDQFPVSVWQTGSGTQFNMNVNEVIANLSIQRLGGTVGSKSPVHPNDHANLSQSSNDTFPTAMHIAAAEAWHHQLRPSLLKLHDVLVAKSREFALIVKIGRTHLQDAVPLTLGQEFSGYAYQIQQSIQGLDQACRALYPLALGGTAVGTGINCPAGWADAVIQRIAIETGLPFVPSANRFAALASHDELVYFSGALRTLSVALLKIATDLAWLNSGPRCGLGEIALPANEAGSSIMPGKVNPTQCEALSMVCIQVMGMDTAVAIAGGRGNFELNVYKPLIIFNVLKSMELLHDSIDSFVQHALADLSANRARISDLVHQSLLLVTALAPFLGYDAAAKIAKTAYDEGLSLRDAAIQSGLITSQQFDQAIAQTLKQVEQQGQDLLT